MFPEDNFQWETCCFHSETILTVQRTDRELPSLKAFLRYRIHNSGTLACSYVRTTQKHNASGQGCRWPRGIKMNSGLCITTFPSHSPLDVACDPLEGRWSLDGNHWNKLTVSTAVKSSYTSASDSKIFTNWRIKIKNVTYDIMSDTGDVFLQSKYFYLVEDLCTS